MLGGPRPGGASFAGESGRIGGVPKRGGLLPKDSFKAEESADSPGPGSEEGGASPRPGKGVSVVEGSGDVSWPGVGICRTAGEPPGNEGTGEPSRAIDCARGTEAAGELCAESREAEGTALGFEDWEGSPAMTVYGARLVCSAAVYKFTRRKAAPKLRKNWCNAVDAQREAEL